MTMFDALFEDEFAAQPAAAPRISPLHPIPAPPLTLDNPVFLPEMILGYRPEEDRIVIFCEPQDGAPMPTVEVDRGAGGLARIRLDGMIVAVVTGAPELEAADIALVTG